MAINFTISPGLVTCLKRPSLENYPEAYGLELAFLPATPSRATTNDHPPG